MTPRVQIITFADMRRKKEGPTTLHTKVSEELYNKLADRAEKERRSVHNMVLFLLEENVDKTE